jgi:hypothetical protein
MQSLADGPTCTRSWSRNERLRPKVNRQRVRDVRTGADAIKELHQQPCAPTVSEATRKTATRRVIPVHSTDLRRVLLRRRNGTDGRPLPGDAYVFGNEVGERLEPELA